MLLAQRAALALPGGTGLSPTVSSLCPQPEPVVGPTRISLISPPQDGRMGESAPAAGPPGKCLVGSPGPALGGSPAVTLPTEQPVVPGVLPAGR